MKTAYLNGAELRDGAELHEALAKQLGFPSHYGHNLDALYDVLTERTAENCRVEIENAETLEERLGGYYRLFLSVLEDAGVSWEEV